MIANNTVQQAKQGLAAGNNSAPFQDMYMLINFIPKVKAKMEMMTSIYTVNDYKQQARKEI